MFDICNIDHILSCERNGTWYFVDLQAKFRLEQ